eukprot:c19202_g1_i1.p2 GENE.c19202_g1_i1~~c19202_g1_i1.p2  ORF type:complete len:159 (+),score=16.70 c19202_g1_i1:141-617(+)
MATTTTFLRSGLAYIRVLHKSLRLQSDQAREPVRRLRKAVLWIMLSSVFQLLQLIGICLTFIPSVLYSPRGYLIVFAILFYGMSFTGLSHVLAFRPFNAAYAVQFLRSVVSHVSFAINTKDDPNSLRHHAHRAVTNPEYAVVEERRETITEIEMSERG